MYLDLVNKYIEAGFSIIPLKPDRLPYSTNWQRFCETLVTEADVDQFIGEFGHENISKAGIGLCLGPASNLIALDFDYNHTDAQFYDKTMNEIVPNSPVAKFGSKGWTKFYRYSPDIPIIRFQKEIIDIDDKVKRPSFADILSKGSYTVLPPTYHEKALAPYKWITQERFPDYDQTDLPILTQDILTKIDILASSTSEEIKDLVNSGGRHNTVANRLFARMETFTSYSDALEYAIKYDKEIHPDNTYFEDTKYVRTPKQKEAYILGIIKRLEKTVINRKKERGLNWPGIGHKVEITEELKSLGDFYKLQTENGYYIEVLTKSCDIIHKPQYQMFGEFCKLSNLFLFNDSFSMIYENNYWQFIDSTSIDHIIVSANKKYWRPEHLNMFYKAMKSCCADRSFNFEPTDNKMNLANGILDIKTNILAPHSNKYLFKSKIPISYDPDAKCTRWIEFLDDTFEGDIELINLAQQIFGYVLIGGNPFLHRIFILYGSGRNGKSTFLDILKGLVGSDNYSTVSMANIQKPFSAVMLDGKLANIVGETTIDSISNEAVKAIAAGEEIIVSRKGYDEYKIKPTARLIFACNKYPDFKDNSVGILDRIVFLPFDRYIEESKRDTDIVSKLEAEYSGILNWALVGAKNISTARSISMPKKSSDVKEEYRKKTDGIYSWFEDCVIYTGNENDMAFTKELFNEYRKWCEESNRIYTSSLQNFSSDLSRILKTKSNGKYKETERFYLDTVRARGFRGIKIYQDRVKVESLFSAYKN